MLKINARQLEAMKTRRRERANRQMAEYAKSRFPATCGGPTEEVMRTVDECRNRASRYGIVREDLVAGFLDFWIMFGDSFDMSEWSADVLNSDLAPASMIQVLRGRVRRTGVSL